MGFEHTNVTNFTVWLAVANFGSVTIASGHPACHSPCQDAKVSTPPWPARSGALLLRDVQPDDLTQILALRNNLVVNHFMLRTHVDPESFRREWMAISDDNTDFSCVAELDGEIAGLGFLAVIDGMGQPGLPQRTQSVIGYMLEPDFAGRELGTDLARGLLCAAFDTLELRRVIANCNADNVAGACARKGRNAPGAARGPRLLACRSRVG